MKPPLLPPSHHKHTSDCPKSQVVTLGRKRAMDEIRKTQHLLKKVSGTQKRTLQTTIRTSQNIPLEG